MLHGPFRTPHSPPSLLPALLAARRALLHTERRPCATRRRRCPPRSRRRAHAVGPWRRRWCRSRGAWRTSGRRSAPRGGSPQGGGVLPVFVLCSHPAARATLHTARHRTRARRRLSPLEGRGRGQGRAEGGTAEPRGKRSKIRKQSSPGQARCRLPRAAYAALAVLAVLAPFAPPKGCRRTAAAWALQWRVRALAQPRSAESERI
jgi:hypothetical protein